MDCCVCGSEAVIALSVEKIPCSHCNEETEVVCTMCNDCGAMWKAVDGIVLECLTDAMPKDLLGDLEKVFDSETASVQVIDLNPKEGNTMSEMIHHCVRCEALAYEIGTGLYKCPSCDFEWEVL